MDWPRGLDGDGNESEMSDIGSVEVVDASFLIVDRLDDTVDAIPNDGVVVDAKGNKTLRAAVMEANTRSGNDVIVLSVGT